MKKLRRDALLADRESVSQILSELSREDPVGALSFGGRLEDIDTELEALEGEEETAGIVALMFGGVPVRGSRSIDAEFASQAISNYQDLVAKRLAAQEYGMLGQRGPVPLRTSSSLAITDMMRGSVGFILEEDGENRELLTTAVKSAIDQVTDIVARTGSIQPSEFASVVDDLDTRQLLALRRFFRTLDEGRATLRIVEGDRDAEMDSPAISRARQRVDATDIVEEESDAITGKLLGLLPESKRFEMRLVDTGEIIRGTVASKEAERYLALIDQHADLVGQNWRTKMNIREVREFGRPPRKLYSLLGLVEQVPD